MSAAEPQILGTSVNQLIREYLEQLADKSDTVEDAAEFERLSRLAQGDSRGWRTFTIVANRQRHHIHPKNPLPTSTVLSISPSLCAAETNPASNCDGARYTP